MSDAEVLAGLVPACRIRELENVLTSHRMEELVFTHGPIRIEVYAPRADGWMAKCVMMFSWAEHERMMEAGFTNWDCSHTARMCRAMEEIGMRGRLRAL